MKITVAQRLRPYSHRPGVSCLLPQTSLRVQVFPALIRFGDISCWPIEELLELSVGVTGPVVDFTVQQDLEASKIVVWGHAVEGYFRYSIRVGEEGIVLVLDKAPENGLAFGGRVLKAKDKFLLGVDTTIFNELLPGRLSLGSHKKQDWDMIIRRNDLIEILPIWLRLGNGIRKGKISGPLLSSCKSLIEERRKEEVISVFAKFFMAGFSEMLVPRMADDQYQGITDGVVDGEPLDYLAVGAELIQGLFIQYDKNILDLLPVLPSEFHCGRLVGVEFEELGVVDIEWSKKMIRKVILRATSEEEIVLRLPRQIKSYRLREGLKDRGKRVSSGSELQTRLRQTYLLDNFQK